MKTSHLFLPTLLTLASFTAELAATEVTTAIDEDNGSLDPALGTGISLREAITHSPADTLITFAPALNGETITLTTGNELAITQSLIIDATDLPLGIIIDGGGNGDFINDSDTNNETRCFFISDDNTNILLEIELRHLTIQNGSHQGPDAGANIHNRENLTLSHCQILNGRSFAIGNGTTNGGGIYTSGASLTIENSTIAHNQTLANGQESSGGGGIFSDTDLDSQATTLTHCTLFGNAAINSHGGALYNFDGQVTLTHCTLSGNTALPHQGSAISSYGDSFTSTTLSACLIIGNGFSDADIFFRDINSFTSLGNNLIGTGNAIDASTFTQPGDQSGITAPSLAPLANYGGTTQTMPPIPGSPAIDAATGSSSTTGQRGFPSTGSAPDIGAVEIQDNADLRTILATAWDTDTDQDGLPFGLEFATGSAPFTPDLGHPNHLAIGLNNERLLGVTFGANPAALGFVKWTVQSAPDLETWDTFFTTTTPSATLLNFLPSQPTRNFFQLVTELTPEN